MTPRLKSATISNFRSIRGQVTVPLDAPVVLIHGQNGAGKTSILSAIELALTGAVPSLGRSEADYMSHLAHKDSDRGRIAVTVDGIDGQSATADLIVTRRGVEHPPLLGGDVSRFFSERCYLAQATLGRLLELYQHQDTRTSDSALTRFVKDLLGLDRLEALIDGLYSAGDVRRLRSSAPSYWSAREDLSTIARDLAKLGEELTQVQETIAALRSRIQGHAASLNPDSVTALDTPEMAVKLFRDDREEGQLELNARARRDLRASASQWTALARETATFERTAVETDEAEARAALGAWRNVTGRTLEAIHQELKSTFLDLPSPSIADPEVARSAAFNAVDRDLKRCDDLLDRDAADATRLSELDQSIEQGKARISVLDTQIAASADVTEGLVQALAQLVPHIHTDDCPVCGRNYHEVSSSPLQAHLSARIARLTEQTGLLNVLASDKARTAGLVTAAERERAEIISRRLASELRDDLKTRRARFEELKGKLRDLESATAEGIALQRRASDAVRRLTDFRSRDERSTSLRVSVGDIGRTIGQPALDAAESLETALARLQNYIDNRELVLVARQRARRAGLEDGGRWKSGEDRRSGLIEEINATKARQQLLQSAKAEADRRLELARALARRAREARTAIVRHVFNDELNRVWRDLFVRLAPEEPFVPAFALPESLGGPVEAVLETHYRAGGKGGTPGIMLSTGNLNTAALTLFLSLHLSVRPVLPWLVIDDPVQSMDEVHIAQFAALLRTLAKQKGRQVVIAVHDRPLFEYLALELSPAFADDRLITIELGRAPDGMTTVGYEPRIYVPDKAIAA